MRRLMDEQEFSTPMMKQYIDIKKSYQDCLVFYRMGDFYELFMEDAHIGAKILGITLTGRPRGKDGRIPMAGVPYHAVDSYLTKLVKSGYKVAICEQVSQPNKYGIIDREVIRIVTPGTVLDEKALDKKENNYIIALTIEKNTIGIATADISTGYFSTSEIYTEDIPQTLQGELSRINPSECILPEKLYNDPEILGMLRLERGLNLYCFHEWDDFSTNAKNFLKRHFGVTTLESFGIEDKPSALVSSAALLGYLQHTQKTTVKHIKKITLVSDDGAMILDRSTMINLELFSTIRDHNSQGSLLSIVDETITAMGGRLLRSWIKKPLTSKEALLCRHDSVEAFLNNREKRILLRDILEHVNDIERVLSRLSVNIGNARDLVHLKESLKSIIIIKDELQSFDTSLIEILRENISFDIDTVISLIEDTIVDEPPIDLRSGNIIRPGINEKLDQLRERISGSKAWIVRLEQQERERTGITSLKVRFNKVFGFYIEISKANLHLIPDNYFRKQTLVNAERFITPELKEQEEIILTSEEDGNELEYQLFNETVTKVIGYIQSLQQAAESIAALDCLLNFAHIAQKHSYTRARIVYSGEITIKEGRHPVVESLLEEGAFVPNDVILDTINQQVLIITGPNMAGKSVFIRQVALIVLMNQIGSFIPAKSARLSLVDRIFVRSGASDVITSGLSTFMVEMVETAHILNHATKHSLIIMDEIGRGTSTYDGISIAWAVAEFLVTHFKTSPKTLFATHYHELQELEKDYPKNIKNFHMSVEQNNGQPIFLHIVAPGGASHSYGVAVARLAGVPQAVITRATEILHELESRHIEEPQEQTHDEPMPLIKHTVIQELEKINIHHMTPLEALNKLAQLQQNAKS